MPRDTLDFLRDRFYNTSATNYDVSRIDAIPSSATSMDVLAIHDALRNGMRDAALTACNSDGVRFACMGLGMAGIGVFVAGSLWGCAQIIHALRDKGR